MSALGYLYERDQPCPFVNVEDKDLVTDIEEQCSTVIDLARIKAISFLLVNSGPWRVVAQPRLSPDGVIRGSFGDLAYEIVAGDKHLFVPQAFLRYTRLMFKSAVEDYNSVITIWFQGQGF